MTRSSKPKSVVIFSGGLDSTTCLYMALRENGNDPNRVVALTFDYKQKHRVEISASKKIAKILGIEQKILKLDPGLFLGSSLTESKISVPKNKLKAHLKTKTIPNTYVPGRNLLFLSFATSLAESIGANRIYIGVNALDYSGYPDCRPEFIASFQKTLSLGTKNLGIQIVTPLVSLNKKEIILTGNKLGVPYHLTHSCYDPIGKKPCGKCDSCLLRQKGFQEAGLPPL